MTFTFDIERDDLMPLLSRLKNRLANRRAMNAEVAGAMFVQIAENFDRMGSTQHNRFGAPSSFWALMKTGTRPGADDASGWVAMPRPVALRYFGGTVYPGEGKKRLAIPARTEAYGKSPRDFSDLRVAFFGGGSMALVQNLQQKVKYGRKRKDGSRGPTSGGDVAGGGVFFWLVPSTTIKPDSRVLPSPDVLKRAGVNGLRSYLAHRAHQELLS